MKISHHGNSDQNYHGYWYTAVFLKCLPKNTNKFNQDLYLTRFII